MMRPRLRAGWVALSVLMAALGAVSGAAWAVQPDEMLKDAGQERRAREVSRELRCVVCQNESIDDSNAELARDLRLLVRDRITRGDSDQQVLDYVVARYGDYVLLRPPFKASTYALWFGPVIFVLLAGLGAWRLFRSSASLGAAEARAEAPAAELTAEEKRRLQVLMKEDGAGQ